MEQFRRAQVIMLPTEQKPTDGMLFIKKTSLER